MSFIVEGGKKHLEYWKALRKTLAAAPIGKSLLEDMDASPQPCTVVFVDDKIVSGDGGASAGLMNPEGDKVPGKAILKHFGRMTRSSPATFAIRTRTTSPRAGGTTSTRTARRIRA